MGSIKLLLQWTSVLTTSFGAILNTTRNVGILLPDFKRMAISFDGNTPVKDVLLLFFQDLLDFYSIALKFFSMKSWVIFFESLWLRHREEINIVTENIQRHAMLLRNEVRLEHIQAEYEARNRAFEHIETTQKAQRHQEFQSINTDISPNSFESKLDWCRGRVYPGTGHWLQRDASFKTWLDTFDASIPFLWLQGIPGAGKTFLSSPVIDEAIKHGYVIYAFLNYNLSGCASAISIIHSLLFQLAARSDDLQEVLCQSARENLTSDLHIAVNLLGKLIDFAAPVYIIVDGLNEIEDIERCRLLSELEDPSKACKNAKMLVSSRAENDIASMLKNKATIRIDSHNSAAIHDFVAQRIRDWFSVTSFTREAEAEIRRMLEPLAATSKGMFLYAKIVFDSNSMLDNIGDIRTELRALPEFLDEAYGRILKRINNLKPPSLRQKAQKLLGWVGCATTPMTIQEMEQALIIKDESTGNDIKVHAPLNVVKLCGPIIGVVDEFVQFVHFTVKEYLFSSSITGYIDIKEATLGLTMCCLTHRLTECYDPDKLDSEIARASKSEPTGFTIMLQQLG